ncbi:MAG TPA: Tudor-knot domain-containing protein [Isosphaeraceae bacterium]|nr:Tudor-knot domain-containing protein [Isosphaeraceae bacterium]
MLGSLLSEPLNSQQVTAIVIVSLSAVCLLIFLMTAVIASTWQKASALKLETALKREMIERGMSAEAIAQVIDSRAVPEGTVSLPCACEAVVNRDGEWQTGLVLQISDDRYYVHYVGSDMDENEWVDEDRIRFRNGSRDSEVITESRTGRTGAPWKQPIETEL